MWRPLPPPSGSWHMPRPRSHGAPSMSERRIAAADVTAAREPAAGATDAAPTGPRIDSASMRDAARPSLNLARARYREIPLYSPNRTPCAIDLSDNTNRFGVPPAAHRVLQNPALDTIGRYPRAFADDLKSALARYAGVRPEEIATGCGSDDVIDSAIRAFSEPGDRIAFPDPTFAMIPIFARMNGLEPVAVPLNRDLDIDAGALISSGARIIYLCSPYNPTGASASRGAIERVLAESP